jgi:hypothetical protein
MERIVRGRSATLTKTFTFSPTGTPTVTLTRVSDGTAVTTGSVTGAAATWSYTIPSTSNTLLDTYVETWTATTAGVAQTFTDYIEVAGDVLFTLAEASAIRLGTSTDTLGARYTTTQITDMRTSVEQAIEDEYGCALVPRYARETVNGSTDVNLRLRWPEIRAVRSATIGGVSTLASVEVDSLFGVYNSAGWTVGRKNVIVGYEHGLDRPPERIKRGGLLLLKRWLVEGPVDDRTTSMSNDDGTFSLATPGRGGSIFGLPELDAAIMASPYRVGVA